MDTRQKLQPAGLRRVLSVIFNDDKNAFAIGLETGFWGESFGISTASIS